jgi:ubiquinone/menaquinone biosynthesis C-methylase UbiE
VNLVWFEDLSWFEEIVNYSLAGRIIGVGQDLLCRRMHKTLLYGMGLLPTDNIIELGFGTGGLTRMIAAALPQGFVAGVDPSPRMWEIARRRNQRAIRERRVDLRVCDPALLPWEQSRFDKAIAINTYQSWPFPGDVLRGLRRVLRPGGAIIMTVRNGSAEVLATLKEAGFSYGQLIGREGSEEILAAFRATS